MPGHGNIENRKSKSRKITRVQIVDNIRNTKSNRVRVPKFNFDFAIPSSSSRVQVLGSLLRTNGTKFYNNDDEHDNEIKKDDDNSDDSNNEKMDISKNIIK